MGNGIAGRLIEMGSLLKASPTIRAEQQSTIVGKQHITIVWNENSLTWKAFEIFTDVFGAKLDINSRKKFCGSQENKFSLWQNVREIKNRKEKQKSKESADRTLYHTKQQTTIEETTYPQSHNLERHFL